MAYMWEGPYGKGAMRAHRDGKRTAAQARNAMTPTTNRRAFARASGFRRNSDRIRNEKETAE